MKDIFYIGTNNSTHNGCSTHRREFLRAMSHYRDFRLHLVLIGCPVEKVVSEVVEGIEYICIPKYGLSWIKATVDDMARYVRNVSTTVLIINTSPTYEFSKFLKGKFPSSRIVYIVHDLLWVSFVKGNKDLFMQIIQSPTNVDRDRFIVYFYNDVIKTSAIVDKIVCLNPETYYLFRDVYGIVVEKLSLIRNGLYERLLSDSYSVTQLRQKYGISDNQKVFIIVGSSKGLKGITYVIEQFNMLMNEFDDIVLVSVGYNASESERKNPRMIFLGAIDNDIVHKWICAADYGIIASYSEQCSYVGIEMKMCCKPVFASDGFGVGDMFASENAYLYSLDMDKAPNDLYKSIRQVLISKELNDMGNRSYTDYIERYTDERMGQDYYKLLTNTI